MGIITRTVCDGCKEECEYYIEINKMKVRSANGKGFSSIMGFQDLDAGPVIFCSPVCLHDFIEGNLYRRNRANDLYVPGTQIGIMRANGKEAGK